MPRLTDHLDEWATRHGHHIAFTKVDYPSPESRGTTGSLTWRELNLRTLVVAEHLASRTSAGDRVALMLPQGLDYVVAFLACLRAGRVAVPLADPAHTPNAHRVSAVLHDCEPGAVLTHSRSTASVRHLADDLGMADCPVMAVDTLPDDVAPRVMQPPAPGSVAYLQYTSGSTRTPAGVMITHRNLTANARQAVAAYLGDQNATGATGVSWLPLFHDMGLVLGIAVPVLAGFPSILMDPAAFLERPVRWLRLLSAFPGALTAAPNFAFDYCVDRIGDDELSMLRLGRIAAMINGSEPVRPQTMDRFQQRFGPAGLRPAVQCPSYGLAEATVFVSAHPPHRAPDVVTLDRESLAAGKVTEAEPGSDTAVQVASCGTPTGQVVRIVRPGTVLPAAQDEVGEVLVQGSNVGHGYWNRNEESRQTFGASIDGEPGTWLRTGDLGALHRGCLVITGRLKDVIIVDGRNHYPQDLEATVQDAVPCVRQGRLAAFVVPARDRDGQHLVVVAEHRSAAEPGEQGLADATRLARAAVSARHGLHLSALRLVPPGSVPRTSSGKIARSACREMFLTGTASETSAR
ncbi:fatty acyl-AMP ligase [Streptomyces sp. NPDC090073]|uniref:fatty acyl-AMP ligase n=1 Tax=Streptomyces sp. NPDC090073 TaxID=3365936 RepID=UPI00382D2CED